MKVGLALGGGGARGLAHIGVLRILEQNNIPITNGLSIIDRAQTILAYQLSRERLGGADIVIRPYSTRYSWASVRYMAEIIKSGEEAALEAIPRIKELINGSV